MTMKMKTSMARPMRKIVNMNKSSRASCGWMGGWGKTTNWDDLYLSADSAITMPDAI